MEGLCYSAPYVDPDFESLIERINPPRVCIDNDSCKDSTLVKVDSVKRHGMLLEVVQILTDLDLLISKSYVSSDGGWFMDVFHVTDQFGHKISDLNLIHYIQQAVCTRRNYSPKEAPFNPGLGVRPLPRPLPLPLPQQIIAMDDLTVLEITMADQPGLLSEVLAVLAELGCHVMAAVVWTHNHRAACIIYMDDKEKAGTPITEEKRLSHIKEQLQTVVEARHKNGEKRSVTLTLPTSAHTHTERRLHQLMLADEDYKTSNFCVGNEGINVSIDSWKEKGYYVLNIKCKDRPKLLFDTVCALTDMLFIVFHAAITSKSSVALQIPLMWGMGGSYRKSHSRGEEYYVRHKGGCTLETEIERQRVTQCLIAAIERRASQGLRLDVTAKDRLGLLSDVTRVFREYGLSVSRAEIRTRGDKATGTFHVTDASGCKISRDMVEAVKREIDGTVKVYDLSPSSLTTSSPKAQNRGRSNEEDNKPSLLSLGSLLRFHFERISSNFGP